MKNRLYVLSICAFMMWDLTSCANKNTGGRAQSADNPIPSEETTPAKQPDKGQTHKTTDAPTNEVSTSTTNATPPESGKPDEATNRSEQKEARENSAPGTGGDANEPELPLLPRAEKIEAATKLTTNNELTGSVWVEPSDHPESTHDYVLYLGSSPSSPFDESKLLLVRTLQELKNDQESIQLPHKILSEQDQYLLVAPRSTDKKLGAQISIALFPISYAWLQLSTTEGEYSARAITEHDSCPTAIIDGNAQDMKLRDKDEKFHFKVCELSIKDTAKSLIIADKELKIKPRKSIERMHLIGNTNNDQNGFYSPQFPNVANKITTDNPELIVHLGDMVEGASDYNQWVKQFFEPAKELMSMAPFVFVRGEKDKCIADRFFGTTDNKSECESVLPIYSFKVRKGKFFVLDSTDKEPENRMRLENDFAFKSIRNGAQPNNFILTHMTAWGCMPISLGNQCEDDGYYFREKFLNKFNPDSLNKFQAIISAHIPLFAMNSYAKHPMQIIVGNGGQSILRYNGPISYGEDPKFRESKPDQPTNHTSDSKYGYSVLEPIKDAWQLTSVHAKDNTKAYFKLADGKFESLARPRPEDQALNAANQLKSIEGWVTFQEANDKNIDSYIFYIGTSPKSKWQEDKEITRISTDLIASFRKNLEPNQAIDFSEIVYFPSLSQLRNDPKNEQDQYLLVIPYNAKGETGPPISTPLFFHNYAWLQLSTDLTQYDLRAVSTDVGCPLVQIDGKTETMAVRARKDKDFEVTVCNLKIADTVTDVKVANQEFKLRKRKDIKKMHLVGDTGFNNSWSSKAGFFSWETAGLYKDWLSGAKPMFPAVANKIAEDSPELIIHMGDYLYSHTKTFAQWRQEFFEPASEMLSKAPLVFVRGNKESCEEHGDAYRRLFDVEPYDKDSACKKVIPAYTIEVAGGKFLILDSSDAQSIEKSYKQKGDNFYNLTETSLIHDLKDFAQHLTDPATNSFIITHRDVWGCAPKSTTTCSPGGYLMREKVLNQDGMEKLQNIQAVLSGHLHLFAISSFKDHAMQIIIGNGGTVLNTPYKIGEEYGPISNDPSNVQKHAEDYKHGYATLERNQNGGWTLISKFTKGSDRTFVLKNRSIETLQWNLHEREEDKENSGQEE